MKIVVKLSETVVNRLSNITQPCSGKLLGILNRNNLTVLGIETNDSSLIDSYPIQLDYYGIFEIASEKSEEVNEKFYVHYKPDTKELKVYLESENTDYTVIEESEVLQQFILLKVTGGFSFKSEASRSVVRNNFKELSIKVSTDIVFNFPKTNLIIEPDKSLTGANEKTLLNDIFEESNGDADEGFKNKKVKNLKPKVLEVVALQRITNFNKDSAKNHAPLCILNKNPQKVINTFIPIDFLVMLDVQTNVLELYDNLVQGFLRYLRLFEATFLNCLDENMNIIELQPFHFFPSECDHFLTRIYPKQHSDALLKTQREFLHKKLLLKENFPIFRRANRYLFNMQNKPNNPLVNPHIGLKFTNKGGEIALVKGKYEYYHYCQNQMDDNGWGCAYRSLQTLASWFNLQGYTDKPVPTFDDIQKCLVDIQDKPRSFLGSKQWIGSTEVSFVLNTLLGVECRILYVSSGEEMASKGPELLDHFCTNGSPVMIGGGVLAHTILGVDYNHETGDLRFLILDPHYTGSEDLYVIQSKGWCGWKGVDFWDKRSYYNMCLPQAPREV